MGSAEAEGGGGYKKKDHNLESDFSLDAGQEDVVCVDLDGEWSEQSKIFPHPSFKNSDIKFVSGEVGEGGDHMNLTFKNVCSDSVTISGDTIVVFVSEDPNEPDPNTKDSGNQEQIEKEKEDTRIAEEEKEKARLAEEARVAEQEKEKARLAEEARVAEEEKEKARLAEEEKEKARLAEESRLDEEKSRNAKIEEDRQKMEQEKLENERIAMEKNDRIEIEQQKQDSKMGEESKMDIGDKENQDTKIVKSEIEEETKPTIKDRCTSDPNFAVVCSFLDQFGSTLGVPCPSIMDLQTMLESDAETSADLITFMVRLLRKMKKSVSMEKWEKALVKFAFTCSSEDGWELDRFGYKKAKLALKIRLIKYLCETQFDLNAKFKLDINKIESKTLRLSPVGKDKLGNAYWFQVDPEANLRVYREDLDEETWELVADTRDQLDSLVSSLTDKEAYTRTMSQ